jgi:hypothetical protein
MGDCDHRRSRFAAGGGRYHGREWSDPAFVCPGFALSTPQYFQYQWLQESPAAGTLVALADLDGDGSPEQRVEVRVTCAAGRCAASALPPN